VPASPKASVVVSVTLYLMSTAPFVLVEATMSVIVATGIFAERAIDSAKASF